ncbi:hypothetical protein B0H11DRAFT_1741049 [Mycena galericulata]|nr:hypothetical protein B0H11DRAFT_1741049 [Mycena galericulata]
MFKISTVPLGPFDSKVSAVVEINGESYFVTTNTDYIPALPIRTNHTIYLRDNFRYGDDDPTLWPQQYSDRFCHLAAIHRKVTDKMNISVMWWDPTPGEFVCAAEGRSITRGLGKPSPDRLSAMAQAIAALLAEYGEYEKSIAPEQPNQFFPLLIHQVRLGIELLQTLPTPYKRMVLAVTNLQRNFLELHALLRYMKVYKPRMMATTSSPAPPDNCIGAFITEPPLAQQFRAAGIPYWLVRPTWTFTVENILAVVTPIDPATRLVLAPAPDFPAIPAGVSTAKKVEAMRAAGRHDLWYRDPFEAAGPEESPSGAQAATAAAPVAGPSTAVGGHHVESRGPAANNSSGSTRGAGAKGRGGAPQNRDKFKALDRTEMPPAAVRWEEALESVDRSQLVSSHKPTDGRYVFPEPALLVSSEDLQRRQLHLHHYTMIRDALLYRLGTPEETQTLPSTQEWRDILAGKVRPAGGNSKAARRRDVIDEVLGPALRACGLSQYHDFPADPASIPLMTVNRAREIIWDVAESNFRFELLSLDRRASGLFRPDKCRQCFVGGMLMGFPLAFAKQGFAASTSLERHPYFLALARLMKDWSPRPAQIILEADLRKEWGETERRQLETAVAGHYTQTFYQLFGRAAVIPRRLEHEFGS